MEMREQVSASAVRSSAADAARAGGDGEQSYVDWAAILGGATVAVALGAVFTGFGGALGLSAISAERGEGSGVLAVVLSTVWIVITMVAAYAAGGYIAGRMRRRTETGRTDEVRLRDGMNGLVVWGLGTILSTMVLGSLVSGAVSTAGNVAAAAGDVAGTIASGVAEGAGTAAAAALPDGMTADPMAWATGSMLRSTTPPPPGAAPAPDVSDEALSILGNVMSTGEISDGDRAWLVQTTATATGLQPPEVEARVDQAVASAQAARDEAARLAAEAEEMARDAAETARIGAVLTGFLLTATALVAAVASYVGAVRGGRHRDEGRIFGGFDWRG